MPDLPWWSLIYAFAFLFPLYNLFKNSKNQDVKVPNTISGFIMLALVGCAYLTSVSFVNIPTFAGLYITLLFIFSHQHAITIYKEPLMKTGYLLGFALAIVLVVTYYADISEHTASMIVIPSVILLSSMFIFIMYRTFTGSDEQAVKEAEENPKGYATLMLIMFIFFFGPPIAFGLLTIIQN